MSDDLTGNKIIGASLATALVMVGLAVVTPKFFESAPPAKPGYVIAVAAEADSGAAAPVAPPDWGTVLKTADVSAGEAKTAVCRACRKPGSHPGFSYSAGMEAFGAKQPIWDYEHIYEFLAGPQKYIDGTKMTFMGIKDSQDRINVIAYLHTLGSSLPIPPPAPAAAAQPTAGAAPAAAAAGAAPAKAGAPA